LEAFVYCWTDHKTNKLYVGSHKGSSNDGYICSSKLMKEQYNKRPQDFTRQIIAEGEYKIIRNLESKILQSVNAKINEDFYNQSNGTQDWYLKYHTEQSKEKMRQNNSRPWLGKNRSEETKRKMSQSMKGKKHKPHYGRIVSEQSKEKNRLSNLGRIISEEQRKTHSIAMMGENNPFYGKKHSEETKEKLRKLAFERNAKRKGKLNVNHNS
jgi:hypothetical protein